MPPPNRTQPSTDDRFLFLPFYPPSSSAPFAPPASTIPRVFPATPFLLCLSGHPLVLLFVPAIPFLSSLFFFAFPLYRSSFLSAAPATPRPSLPHNMPQGSLFLDSRARGTGLLLRASDAHRWLFPFTLQGPKTTQRTDWLTGGYLQSLSLCNRTYRPRSCLVYTDYAQRPIRHLSLDRAISSFFVPRDSLAAAAHPGSSDVPPIRTACARPDPAIGRPALLNERCA